VTVIEVLGLRLVTHALGYAAGDALLMEIEKKIQALLLPGQTLGRLSENRFAIIARSLDEETDLGGQARRLLLQLRRPIRVQETDLFATVAIGTSLYPWDGIDAQTLMRHADIAVHRSRRLGGNAQSFYSSSFPGGAARRLETMSSLHKAVENGELRLRFQPQADRRMRLAGMEVLVGWEHPRLGRIPAGKFIPVAENSRLIVDLDTWVLRETCRQLRRWKDAGAEGLRFSVNVSALQFSQPDFVGLVLEVLRETGLDPSWLELEITEYGVMRNVEESAARMGLLKDLGLRLSLDDFGTGYSSLNYLRRLPVDAVKIDRSFVEGIETPGGSHRLVESMIGMMHNMGITVVAEGVENMRQWSLLKKAGCDRMQGYMLGYPLDCQAAGELLSSDRRLLVGGA
jgi:EAL domain-containing protein (putative c-di-GMP-specific phosphodiesterase class I)